HENLNQDIIDTYINLTRVKKFMLRGDEMSYEGFSKYLKEELLKISPDVNYIVDVLTYFLYSKGNKNKETLWDCFGEVIYENIEKNLGKSIQCETCTNRFEQKTSKEIYCEKCKKERIK